MTREERGEVKVIIDNEGMDYALRYAASYDHIEDEEFQKRLQEYIDAANAIEEYLG